VFSPNEAFVRTPTPVVWMDDDASAGRIVERLVGMPASMAAANDCGRRIGGRNRQCASAPLNEMGFRPAVIERQLAHQERNAVSAAYNRAENLSERRTMMNQWADYLDVLAAVTLYGAFYNLCRTHEALRTTPTMALGIHRPRLVNRRID